MLIPRFTLRWLLLVITVSGVFFLIVRHAVGGAAWATAVSVGVGSLLLAFLCYAALFGVAYVAALMFGVLRRGRGAGNPFATAAPPPQIIPPDEPV